MLTFVASCPPALWWFWSQGRSGIDAGLWKLWLLRSNGLLQLRSAREMKLSLLLSCFVYRLTGPTVYIKSLSDLPFKIPLPSLVFVDYTVSGRLQFGFGFPMGLVPKCNYKYWVNYSNALSSSYLSWCSYLASVFFLFSLTRLRSQVPKYLQSESTQQVRVRQQARRHYNLINVQVDIHACCSHAKYKCNSVTSFI